MPNISDIQTTETIGFDGRGGLSSNADGDFNLANDAATNSFQIDVDGSTGLAVEDNRVEIKNGTNPQELRIYGSNDGAGNTQYISVLASNAITRLSALATGAETTTPKMILSAEELIFQPANDSSSRIAAYSAAFNEVISGRGVYLGDPEAEESGATITLDVINSSCEFSAIPTIKMPDLPTSDPVVAGQLWVDPLDGYTIKQSQG